MNKKTSLGFKAIEFAECVLCIELMPWQKWWLIHALEVDSNGDFRFRTIVTLVSRQNGKTTLAKVLILFMMYTGRVRLVLGAAQSLDIAREAWSATIAAAEDDDDLRSLIASTRRTNGEQEFQLVNGARYKIAAATGKAGRGLSVDLLFLDELREQRDFAAWGALSNTTMARPNALTLAFSNAGDDDSVVLNQLRDNALSNRDESLGIFEWSAPDDCALDDEEAIAQANPGLGHTINMSAIRSKMASDPPAVFRVETLCQRVNSLDAAISIPDWDTCKDTSGSLADYRDKIVACLDVSPDGRHVTLVGAAQLDDGRVRVESLGDWRDTAACRTELAALLDVIRPVVLGWYPSGPAASLAADMAGLGPVVELKGSGVAEACMGLAEFVSSRRLVHPGDPLLTAHAAGAAKLYRGDNWVFSRRGGGHCDALYAVAGAVHIARTHVAEKPVPLPWVV